jgi:hypothetical protein
MKIPGTNTVDPIRGSVILNVGTHPITVIEEEFLEKTEERLKIKLRMEAIGGEEEGGRISDTWTITAKSAPYILSQIEAFGVELPEDDFEWVPLVGRNCKVVVRKEKGYTDPSKEFSVVKAYEKLADVDLSKVKSEFEAEEISGSTGADDDIPF